MFAKPTFLNLDKRSNQIKIRVKYFQMDKNSFAMKINVKRQYITGSNNQLYKDVYKIVIRSYLIKSFRFKICISCIV